MLRVAQILPFEACQGALFDYLNSLPLASQYLGFEAPPPILVLSDVFEPDLCATLIRHFDQNGGKESGFMQDVDGKPVEVFDPEWKRRRDHMINDPSLIRETRRRIARRVAPEMQKAFHFKATRTERDLIGCYGAEDRAHFGAHRDDVTATTAHRQFAVSVNLNHDFEGGESGFPEFGPRRFKGPIGAAIVFSCSMLHDVSKVTKGRRYAFLTFLFDEAGEQTRLANSGKKP
jgi:predicted 2-oxoglutarate/Fe(II)-dependent dioxygenase YbiX